MNEYGLATRNRPKRSVPVIADALTLRTEKLRNTGGDVTKSPTEGEITMAADNFVDDKLLCGVTSDLDEELFHFSNHKPWQSGLFSKVLVKADDLRVVLIAMDAGATMKEHHTDGTTSVQVLQGKLCIHIEDTVQHLQTKHMLTLAPGIKHDLEALDDSAFLVTFSWPSSDKLQSLPHRGYGS